MIELIDALKELRDRACTETVPRRAHGICQNSRFLVPEPFLEEEAFRYHQKRAIESWPLIYSKGNTTYPIGGSSEFLDNWNLWEGDSLYLRLSLINHMINLLENERWNS